MRMQSTLPRRARTAPSPKYRLSEKPPLGGFFFNHRPVLIIAHEYLKQQSSRLYADRIDGCSCGYWHTRGDCHSSISNLRFSIAGSAGGGRIGIYQAGLGNMPVERKNQRRRSGCLQQLRSSSDRFKPASDRRQCRTDDCGNLVNHRHGRSASLLIHYRSLNDRGDVWKSRRSATAGGNRRNNHLGSRLERFVELQGRQHRNQVRFDSVPAVIADPSRANWPGQNHLDEFLRNARQH